MKRWLFHIIIALTVSSCTYNSAKEPPVPRRKAYHRIEIPDSIYTPFTAGKVTFQFNSAIDSITSTTGGWVTAIYPGEQAMVYITISPLTPATAAQTIDNRVERLSLNTGGNPTEVTSLTTPSHLDAQLIVTPGKTPTPVQFLATDHQTILVSGTSSVKDATTAPADSLSPVIKMLERDFVHLLKTLSVE